jgi:peptide/nickel transport system permease protein
VTAAPASIENRRRWWADRPRSAYFARRLLRLLVSLVLLLTLTFAMIHFVPGDPVRTALGVTAPAKLVAQRRAQLGLDKPLWQQYADYVDRAVHGDFGTSLTSGEPITEIVRARLPTTLRLAGLAFLAAVLVGVPLGVLSAALTRDGRRRYGELAFTTATGAFASVPGFLVAVGLIYLFGIKWRVFPVAGESGPSSYVLPIIALAIGPAAALARIVRVEGLKVLDQDYIRTARGKRLSARLIYLRHALPNMLTATLTISGLLLGGLIAGTVLIETIFAWTGLGSTLINAVTAKDYPSVQAVALVFGFFILLINFVVDMLLAVINPQSTILEQ